MYAHRRAWEEASGERLAKTERICHTCDNPPCIRNDEQGTYEVGGISYPRWGHLWKAPSNAANMQDKVEKGRGNLPVGERHWSHLSPGEVLRGERSGKAKMTTEQVIEIRRRHATGDIGYTALGREYGVSNFCIKAIVTRTTWKHVE